MAKNSMSEFIQHLRRTMLVRDGADLTDGQLLEDYISRRDEAALAALVQRHAPMVWGVCRRVLRNDHDAEDTFQATFLVLVRKATSIMPREMVANWLYGVARQTALKARATAAKRCVRERQVAKMPELSEAEQDLWHNLQPLLDEELSHLPDKYRAIIVLCDLEGKTRKEVARQLGVPEGTVASRMATARRLLAKRIARHGLSVSGGALTAVLTEKVASAGVPTSVVTSTIKAVTLVAAGQAAATAAISVKVTALTEGVLKTMLLTKVKIASVVLLGVAIASVSTGRWLYPVKAKEPVIAREEGEKEKEGKKENVPTPPKKKSDTDKDKIQGRWQVVVDEAMKERVGKDFPIDEYESSTFIVRGDQIIWELKSKKVKGTIHLDEKEKTFALHYEGDGIEGKYRIVGDSVVLEPEVGYVAKNVLPGKSPPAPLVLKKESQQHNEKKGDKSDKP